MRNQGISGPGDTPGQTFEAGQSDIKELLCRSRLVRGVVREGRVGGSTIIELDFVIV
jgi:hypothetical protein